MSREAQLTRTLVQLADRLVDEFDVVDLLIVLCERCVEILDVSAAGVMLVTEGGELQCVASSSEAMRLLEVFEAQADEGPCPECFRSGEPVVNVDLAALNGPWPEFAPKALAAGFRSVHALPMHLRGRTIGALNMFRANEGQMSDADVAVAQALADTATISLMAQQAAADIEALNQQRREALANRIVIEQAKGIVAESLGVDIETAFSGLRDHARASNEKLSDVAQKVVDRTLAPQALAGGADRGGELAS